MNYCLTNELLLTKWLCFKNDVLWYMTNKLSDKLSGNCKLTDRKSMKQAVLICFDFNYIRYVEIMSFWKRIPQCSVVRFIRTVRNGDAIYRPQTDESVPKLLIIFFRCSISAREWWAFSFARISSSCLLSASLRSWISFNSCIKNISLLLLNVTITTLCIINRTVRLLMT